MRRSLGKNMTSEPVTIGSTVSISEAREIMQTWGMRHLPITNENGQVMGILSDRDFSRIFGTHLKGSDSVMEIMTPSPFVLLPKTPVLTALEAMASEKYGCVVVVNEVKEVIGIFTTIDAIKILLKILKDPGIREGNLKTFSVLNIEDYFDHFSKSDEQPA